MRNSKKQSGAPGFIGHVSGGITFDFGATVPADASVGYSPGCLFIKTGGAAGAQLYVNQGTKASAAFKAVPDVTKLLASPTAGLRVVGGQITTASAADTVVTGLTTVVAVVASYDDSPGDANLFVSATIGDQNGTPAAGSVIIKTWKTADGTDPTPVAATAFTKKVNWIAIGT